MTLGRQAKLTLLAVFGVGAAVLLACGTRYALHKVSGEPEQRAAVAPRTPVNGLGPAQLRLGATPAGARRLMLDAAAMDRLRDAARRDSKAFRFVKARADEALARPVDSGYQGFEWADLVANLSLAWLATGEASYGEGGVRYLRALLDDRLKIGDAKGGATVVKHDSGYGIRTFGAYTALGYDWLRGAPGMDDALRERCLTRLGEWLDWYATDGYLKDVPLANYYWGYLTTLAFAGLAASGESEAADRWLAKARDELSKSALPALRDDLRGGGWPEGWQYGEYTTVEIALVARSFQTAAGVDMTKQIPWLSETVTHHVHALLPDEKSVYDGGTWGEHPAKPSAAGMSAAVVALDAVGDPRADEARWLIANALPPLRREQAWVGLLADRADAKARPPRENAPASLHIPGQGLTFARSDWSKGAVWASFQAGPRLAEDHQDADQGHFELFRGGDGLLVDGGNSEGSATINHNTLLVDDGGRNMNYPPNQGVWGRKVKTTRFADDGAVVVAVGDIGEAYAPKCASSGCDQSVERIVRTFVYVRPGVLVVDDRIVLEQPDIDVVWAAHVTTAPAMGGAVASAVVGDSRVDVRTLLPEGARAVAQREPTPSGEGSHRANAPWGPMWRLEVVSPKGERERAFLHFITTDRAGGTAPDARRLTGEGMRGAFGTVLGKRLAVLLADAPKGGSVALGSGADTLVVAGLEPGRRYRVEVDRATCTVRVAASEEATSLVVNRGGFVRARAECGAP